MEVVGKQDLREDLEGVSLANALEGRSEDRAGGLIPEQRPPRVGDEREEVRSSRDVISAVLGHVESIARLRRQSRRVVQSAARPTALAG